jgi:hypothetical protein
MKGFEKNEDFERNESDKIFSKAVRAGKRTYFFDVKATLRNDYYLTVTESKRNISDDGSFHYEKHKIFLYKEDFDKFVEGLQESIDYIKGFWNEENGLKPEVSNRFTGLEFEDINK